MLRKLKNNQLWPKVEKKYRKWRNYYSIQINGKKRGLINLKKDTDEQIILNEIKDRKLIDKYLKDKEIFKVIYVKNKIINIIIK